MTKTLNARFAALQTIFFVNFCVSVAYIVPMLSSLGYKTIHITLIMTGSAIVCSVAQPLLGHLCDAFGHQRLIVLFCTVSPALYLFVLWRWGAIPGIAAVAAALTSASVQSMTGVIDSWASKLKSEGHTLNFGATRSLGSMSYALTSLAFGLLLDRFGIRIAPVALLICFPLMLAALLRIPEPVPHKNAGGDFPAALKSLLAVPQYRLLLICYFLVMLPFASQITYFPLLFQELGGTSSQLGLAYFLASSEIISMLLYARLRRRLKCETLLLAAFIVFGLKNLLAALAPNVPALSAVNLLQFGCYGLLVPGVVDFLSSRISRGRLSTAQLIANAVGLSISQIVGNFCFGLLADALGLRHMFIIAAFPAFAGAAIWIAGNRAINRKRANEQWI